jgi:PKD repeat protein
MLTSTYTVHLTVTNAAGSNSKFQAGHIDLTPGSGVQV